MEVALFDQILHTIEPYIHGFRFSLLGIIIGDFIDHWVIYLDGFDKLGVI